MIAPPVHYLVGSVVGGAILLVGEGNALDVQVSGTVVISTIGTIIGLLLVIIAWFARTQFEDLKGSVGSIKTDQSQQGIVLQAQNVKLLSIETSVGKLEAWKDERTKAHDENNKEQLRILQQRLEESRKVNTE